jgi:hypothetical protein
MFSFKRQVGSFLRNPGSASLTIELSMDSRGIALDLVFSDLPRNDYCRTPFRRSQLKAMDLARFSTDFFEHKVPASNADQAIDHGHFHRSHARPNATNPLPNRPCSNWADESHNQFICKVGPLGHIFQFTSIMIGSLAGLMVKKIVFHR